MFPEETSFVQSTTAEYFLEGRHAAADDTSGGTTNNTNTNTATGTAANTQLLRMHNCSNKEGVSRLVETHGIEAILMGTRSTDPDGRWLSGVFWPSSKGWPPFMRVNPCLDWSYNDVWVFLRFFAIPYCALYDEGYTSIGSRSTSRPNPQLWVPSVPGGGGGDGEVGDDSPTYLPAYRLADGSLERAGRG